MAEKQKGGGSDRVMEGDGEDARGVNKKWGCRAICGNSGLAGARKFGARGNGRWEMEGEVRRNVGRDGKRELGRG